jgi:hypothetical protein
MKKTLIPLAALALMLGMSGSAFADPGSQQPPNGGGPLAVPCPAGQGGVVVLGLRDLARFEGKTPGEKVNEIIDAQTTPGADDFVQESHSYCHVGREDPVVPPG